MNPNALLESATLRQELCQEENIGILERVGQLVTLPATGYATTEQVAEFYQVSEETIKKVVIRHYDEFKSHGYKTLSKNELREGHDVPLLTTFKGRSCRIAIFPRPAILLLGCLLRDSLVAREVRFYLIRLEPTGLSSLLQKMTSLEQRMTSLEQKIESIECGQEGIKTQMRASELGQEETQKRMSESEKELAILKKWAWNTQEHITGLNKRALGGSEEMQKRMRLCESILYGWATDNIASIKMWILDAESGSEEIKKQVTHSREDIAYLKKWALSLETYLIEWENRFTAEEPLLGEGRGQTISARQSRILKQKIHEQPDWPKVLKEFKKHFGLRRYSALPLSEWEAALAWFTGRK